VSRLHAYPRPSLLTDVRAPPLLFSLAAFGLGSVEAAETYSLATRKDRQGSLQSTPYDVIIICADVVQLDEVLHVQQLQPKAKVSTFGSQPSSPTYDFRSRHASCLDSLST
jgi:hypothetical protein